MSSFLDNLKREIRAEITEEVLNEYKGSILTEVIDTMITHHEDMIRVLLYDDALAQNQSTADTLMRREIKADLVEGSKTPASDLPTYYPPGDPRSPFNIGDTHSADAQMFNAQDEITERGDIDDSAIKDVAKAKASEVSSEEKNKSEKEKETRLSLRDRLVAAAKDSLSGLGDPGHSCAQDLRKKFGMQDP